MEPDQRVPRTDEIRIHIKPEYLLRKAREENGRGNFPQAFENYVEYLDNLQSPDQMQLVDQADFTKVALKLGHSFEQMESEEEALKIYVQILNFFPKNCLVLNALSTYLFNKGEFDIAFKYLVKAAAEGYLPSEKNLLHVIWHLIPRWHFRMLNDTVRNQSYKTAIEKAINAGYKNVIDIGTGCGLLSLIAAQADKAVSITAFEENKTLYQISQKIFKEKKIKNVNLLQKNSTELTIPIIKCNLIVTEIFDAGLFGEECLPTIYHAVNTFVTESEFRVIPAGAKLYVTAVESMKISSKYRYIKTLPELGLENICLKIVDPEPYDAEFLKEDPTLKYLSQTEPFYYVNFNNKHNLYSLISKGHEGLKPVELKCTEDGTIHAFAVWFDLDLDKDVQISTKPDSQIKCWEQAIFNLDHPLKVTKDEVVILQPRLVNNQLNFTITSHTYSCQKCFTVTREVISFLNDEKLVKSISDLVNSYTDYKLKILDFNVFPLFGLLMVKKGAMLYHVYRDYCDLEFYEYLMEINDFSKLNCIFVHQKALEEYVVYLNSIDLVFNDLIKNDGSWNRVALTEETEAKLNARALPKKIFLQAQVIHSEYLDFCNKVNDKKALKFGIAKHLNEFSGTEHPTLESLEHMKFSPVVTFDISDFEITQYSLDVEILKNGQINGILYWFIFQYTDDESLTFSTLDSTYYGKTCTYFKNAKTVKKGEMLQVRITREECYLKVHCD